MLKPSTLQRFAPLLLSIFIASCGAGGQATNNAEDPNDLPQWISLFNGQDLDDWIVKIRGYELNENFGNTFRVEDGVMKVNYEAYDDFRQQYGHIYYKEPFSAYLLSVEYRFTGEQAPGGEGWAIRNSGAMLHCQDPATLGKDQDFPISIEAQFLGGDGEHDRTTANLCTPGTNVIMNGELFTPHCVNSSSQTYHGEQWVRADLLVLRDSVIKHIVEGDTVLEYSRPTIGGGNVVDFDPAVKEDGKALTSGYIALQSESHPVEFRKVELVNLEPYMDHPARLHEILNKLKARALEE